MRAVTDGISHETSTFTPVATNLQSYVERFYLHELDILNTFHGTNTPIGGFIAGAESHGFDLIPIPLLLHSPVGSPLGIFMTPFWRSC